MFEIGGHFSKEEATRGFFDQESTFERYSFTSKQEAVSWLKSVVEERLPKIAWKD
jgi:hypothetical protein